MKVKCIGGPNDGEWHHVPDYNRLNDQVRIPQKVEFKVLDYFPLPDEISAIVAQRYNFYMLKELYYKNKETVFRFLIPIGEDEWKCLVKQLEK